jgi:flagellar biosynthesis protein FlhA
LKGAEVVRGELASDGVLDPAHALVAHVGEVVRRHAHELLGRQEVQGLLDGLARSRPKAVDEVMPVLLTLGGVQRVLQNLLGERVSIRDLATILETLAEHAGHTKDPVVLTEHVRRALGRAITERLLAADGTLVVVTLDPPLEQALGDALAPGEECDARALDPATAERLVRRLAEWTARLVAEGAPPVLVCSPRLRPWLRRFLEVHLPELAVLAPSEARLAARVRAFGVVTLDHA